MFRDPKLNVVFLLLSLSIVAGSCTTIQKLANNHKPKLSVKDVHVTDFAFDAIELTFDIKVDNPNPVGLKLLSYDYGFDINDNSFVEGSRKKGLSIGAAGSSIIHVPITLDFQELYSLFNSLKGKDKADYTLATNLTFNVPVVGKTTIPLKHSGSIPMIHLPKISVAGLQVENMSLSNVDFELIMRVKNPNSFGLLLNGFSYQLQVNNNNWLDTRFTKNVKVGEDGSSLIRIPISLNTMNIGASVIDILQNTGNLNYSLKGKFDISALHPLLGATEFLFSDSGKLPVMMQ